MTDPTTFDRYRVLKLLGEGGMGQVHLASAQGAAGFEKLVALKVLGARHSGDAGRMHSLLREAMIGVRLDNEHVVQILDFGEENGRYFIAMEYVRGFNLLQVIRHCHQTGAPMPVRVAVHIARTVAIALDYVHQFQEPGRERLALIHGDVSPGNVLLAADGRIKLADFGVAALQREVEGSPMVAGKLPYLPPEAYRGERPNQGWDVYALGTALYESLTGLPAFPGDNIDEINLAFESPPPAISAVRSDCPNALGKAVYRAIAHDPNDRFASAAELRDALDGAFPRTVDDARHHAEFIARVYSDTEFVSRHGQLPTTGGFRSTLNLRPMIEDLAERETAVNVPTTPQLVKFGLSPALGADLARSVGERLSSYLSARLGRPVRTVVFADYRALVESTASGEVDIAWMPPFAYAHAEEMSVGALVTAERGGRPTYQSALIVRDDSDIREIADLRGRSVAWVDRESASGFLFAAAEIARELGRLDDVLGRQHFFGSHREVCEAVASSWADAGATYASCDSAGKVMSGGWLDTLGDRAEQIRAVAYSAPIPGDNIAHRPYLPDSVRADVSSAFIGMRGDDEGRGLLAEVFNADGFVGADRSLYEAVRSRLRLL